MSDPTPSPIFPTCACALPSAEIEGLYAGRFIALPFEELQRLALEAFPEDGQQRLDLMISCAKSGTDAREAQRALDDFITMMRRDEGVMGEEMAHHRDLVRTPLWGLLNAIAVCERLHLIAAQSRYHGSQPTAVLRQALGHALRLHLLRRYLDGQKWPVVETLFLLPSLMKSSGPWQDINDFESVYGSEAGTLAEVMWKRIEYSDERSRALQECQRILLAALDYRWLTKEKWPSLLDRGLALLDYEARFSRLQQRALEIAGKEKSDNLDKREHSPLRLTRAIAEYLAKIRCRGLLSFFLNATANTFTLSLVPLIPRLLVRDPYAKSPQTAEQKISVPALRSYLPDGTTLIIDPASVTARSRRLSHTGMENLLEVGISSYAIDQLIIRRMVDLIGDREGLWSSRLEDFIYRWTAVDENCWMQAKGVVEKIQPGIQDMAVAASERGRDEIGFGYYSVEMMHLHLQARNILLAAVAQEYRSQISQRPVHELLHAYYMHGL